MNTHRKFDDKPGLSIEDGEFLDIMEGGTFTSDEGRWIAPLPFRASRRRLPDNRPQAVKRTLAFSRSLTVSNDGVEDIGFLIGKSKVAPKRGQFQDWSFAQGYWVPRQRKCCLISLTSRLTPRPVTKIAVWNSAISTTARDGFILT